MFLFVVKSVIILISYEVRPLYFYSIHVSSVLIYCSRILLLHYHHLNVTDKYRFICINETFSDKNVHFFYCRLTRGKGHSRG